MIYSNLIHIQTLFDKFHVRTKYRSEGLSLSIIMAKAHVFIVFKLMTSSDFSIIGNYPKRKMNLKKIGVVHWVVHGRGTRGGPWTGGKCFQLSLIFRLSRVSNFLFKNDKVFMRYF